jgi:thiol oxidase
MLKTCFLTIHCAVIVSIIYINEAKTIKLFEPDSGVETWDSKNFEQEVFQSPKASIVMFFASWCGHCQRFSTRWKAISNNTKLWHDKVIRVAGVDCALLENAQICSENLVDFYPKFAFFKPHVRSRVGIRIADELSSLSNDDIIKMMIEFVEKLTEKPQGYPVLQPYRYAA